MLKTELEIVTVGTPDIATLSENEQRIFFETIFERVLELAKEKKCKVMKWIVMYCIETEMEWNVSGCNVLRRPMK